VAKSVEVFIPCCCPCKNPIEHCYAQLRDIWASQAAQSGTARVDALSWLSKATLDMIGLAGKFRFYSVAGSLSRVLIAGFNYNFNSLASESQTELAAAFSTVFHAGTSITPIRALQTLFPVFRIVVRASSVHTQSQKC
jgi:hypothetical protein